MRVSSEVNDSGFWNLSRHKYIHVYLDGKLVTEPITADEALGYVKYRVCGFDGRLVTHEVNGDQQPLTLEKYGKVSIKASDRLTRISVEDDDPGCCYEAYGSVRIFLDGELVEYAITADEELGYVKCFQLGDDGLPILIEERDADGDRVRIKKEKYGVVRIDLEPDREASPCP